jgi:hypothetical protein
MIFAARRTPASSFKFLCVFLLGVLALEGCNRNQNAEHGVDEYFKNTPNAKRLPLAKLAGRVTFDGQPPGSEGRLFVLLSDPDHPNKPDKTPPIFAKCDEEGKFQFTTYDAGDGVPFGKYVVTFAQLHRGQPAGRGLGMRGPAFTQQYVGPDGLKNLYNDPQKNKSDQTFVINVEAPGRTDYEFNLTLAGKDAVPTPGEYAVTHLTN